MVIHDKALVKNRDRSSRVKLDASDKVKGSVTMTATGSTEKLERLSLVERMILPRLVWLIVRLGMVQMR